jgi:hypothetical protein
MPFHAKRRKKPLSLSRGWFLLCKSVSKVMTAKRERKKERERKRERERERERRRERERELLALHLSFPNITSAS